MSNPAGARMVKGSSRGKVSTMHFLHDLSHPSSSNPSCIFKRSLSNLMAGVASRFKISAFEIQCKNNTISNGKELSHIGYILVFVVTHIESTSMIR